MDFKAGGFSRAVIDAVLKITFIAILLIYTYDVLSPFINLFIWSLIITISLGPMHQRITHWFKGRKKLASLVLTLFFLALILGPFGYVIGALVENLKEIKGAVHPEALVQMQPNEEIKEWPLIGSQVFDLWEEFHKNQGAFFENHRDKIIAIGEFLVGTIASAGKSVLLFMGAMIISGFLLIYTDERQSLGVRIGKRLAGGHGGDFANLTEKTIRSVVTGVLGVAIIQTILAGIGFFVMQIPYAAVWTILALLLAIVQLGVGPVVIVTVIYAFYTRDTTPAVLFLIWSIVVTLSDNVLKPMLMGRGLEVPTIVIFIGALGGMLYNGILGLFLGPVILAIVYKLFTTWLDDLLNPDELEVESET